MLSFPSVPFSQYPKAGPVNDFFPIFFVKKPSFVI